MFTTKFNLIEPRRRRIKIEAFVRLFEEQAWKERNKIRCNREDEAGKTSKK